MAYLRVPTDTGGEWVVSAHEIVIPVHSLDSLSGVEIGERVLLLAIYAAELGRIQASAHPQAKCAYSSPDELRAALAEAEAWKKEPQTHHGSQNLVWQFDYRRFTVEDFEAMLADDERDPLFTPPIRAGVKALVANPGSWADIAIASGVSRSSARERIKRAIALYAKRHSP